MAAQRNSVDLAQGKHTDLGPKRTQVEKPTLADAGIDKHLADRARKLVAVPEKKFEQLLAGWRVRFVGPESRNPFNLAYASRQHLQYEPQVF
jgi:hypothetical protein